MISIQQMQEPFVKITMVMSSDELVTSQKNPSPTQ
jgi:hypothetical protein